MFSRFYLTSHTSLSSIPFITRSFYAQDKALEYLEKGKNIDPNVKDPEALKKRFLFGIHPKIVQSDAFKRFSVSAMRQNTLQLQEEGQHPAIAELIKESEKLDKSVDATWHGLERYDFLHEFTGRFKYGNYRSGDEDSVLNMDFDWEFFKEVIPDTEFVDNFKNTYEECLEDLYQETLKQDPVPKELATFERFNAQFSELTTERYEPLMDTVDDADYDLKNIPDAIEEIIHDWDQVKLWVAAPRVAAYIQNKIDNNMWLMEDESEWCHTDQVPR